MASQWKEYFEELMNVSDDKEVELSTLGRGGMKGNIKENWKQISEKQVMDEVVKVK